MEPGPNRRPIDGQVSSPRWRGRFHCFGRRSIPIARPRPSILSVAMVACLATSLHAQAGDFSGVAALSSQLVYRGLAITPSTPVLQGAASWVSPTGWSLGLSASAEVRSPGHLAEAMAQASRFWSLSGNWQMQANLLYYRYPSNGRSGIFDRAEAGINWMYRDVLTLGLSADWFIGASDTGPHPAADIGFNWPLARHFSFSAGAGVAQYLTVPQSSHSYNDGYGYERGEGYGYGYGYAGTYDYDHVRTYRYGHAGLIWSFGPWRVELDRIVTDFGSYRPSSNLSTSPWVATISRSF